MRFRPNALRTEIILNSIRFDHNRQVDPIIFNQDLTQFDLDPMMRYRRKIDRLNQPLRVLKAKPLPKRDVDRVFRENPARQRKAAKQER